jgi:hypothetical protein
MFHDRHCVSKVFKYLHLLIMWLSIPLWDRTSLLFAAKQSAFTTQVVMLYNELSS